MCGKKRGEGAPGGREVKQGKEMTLVYWMQYNEFVKCGKIVQFRAHFHGFFVGDDLRSPPPDDFAGEAMAEANVAV